LKKKHSLLCKIKNFSLNLKNTSFFVCLHATWAWDGRDRELLEAGLPDGFFSNQKFKFG
jgi:hypothetical protein